MSAASNPAGYSVGNPTDSARKPAVSVASKPAGSSARKPASAFVGNPVESVAGNPAGKFLATESAAKSEELSTNRAITTASEGDGEVNSNAAVLNSRPPPVIYFWGQPCTPDFCGCAIVLSQVCKGESCQVSNQVSNQESLSTRTLNKTSLQIIVASENSINYQLIVKYIFGARSKPLQNRPTWHELWY